MGYRQGQAPGDLDTEGLRKYTQEQLLKIQRSMEELASTVASLQLSESGHHKFIYVSSTQCRLIPYNGNGIKINGDIQTIPDAGVNIANTALAISTATYVYAYMSGGSIALEFSTTVHVPSVVEGNKGVEIKSGDNTRTLVGFVYGANGTNTFVDNAVDRRVRSWLNDSGVTALATTGTLVSTPLTTPVETDGGVRTTALLWAKEQVVITGTAQAFNNTANQIAYLYVMSNGVVNGVLGFAYSVNANTQAEAVAITQLEPASDVICTFTLAMASSGAGSTAFYAAKSTSFVSTRK